MYKTDKVVPLNLPLPFIWALSPFFPSGAPHTPSPGEGKIPVAGARAGEASKGSRPFPTQPAPKPLRLPSRTPGPGGEGLEVQWVGALASEQGLGPGATFQQGSSSSSGSQGPLTRSTSSAPSRCWGWWGAAGLGSKPLWMAGICPFSLLLPFKPQPTAPPQGQSGGGQGRQGKPQSPPWKDDRLLVKRGQLSAILTSVAPCQFSPVPLTRGHSPFWLRFSGCMALGKTYLL